MRKKFNSILMLCSIVLILGYSQDNLEKNYILVPGGDVDIGSEEGLSSEQPVNNYSVKSFYLSVHPVTVKQFRDFVEATNYQTEADRYGNSGVFSFIKQQWYMHDGANWEYPLGRSNQMAIDDHPVTQVSWNDAIAYTLWKGVRLPTEIEWEHAARNGINSRSKYPWGNKFKVNNKFRANVWQGTFPFINTNEDGFMTTSSVTEFPPTSLGLYDMAGNVWEWTSSEYQEGNSVPMKTIKGGSFLCEPDFCHGYRVSSRMGTTPDTSLMHTGFRTARD
jgi:sulfatase modifying factor 1